jgi:hypothetical protein
MPIPAIARPHFPIEPQQQSEAGKASKVVDQGDEERLLARGLFLAMVSAAQTKQNDFARMEKGRSRLAALKRMSHIQDHIFDSKIASTALQCGRIEGRYCYTLTELGAGCGGGSSSSRSRRPPMLLMGSFGSSGY